MAEEKKTSTKADAKSEMSAKSAMSKDKKQSKKNPFKFIAPFFKSVQADGKKVVWAPAKDVLKNTIIVLVVVIIAGLAIYGVDSLLSLGMKGIKNLAETTTTTSASQQGNSTTAAALDKATTAETTKAAE